MSEQRNNPPKTESRSALQRLLIVLAVFAGLLIYSYGWTVTEIDLDKPKQESRQEHGTRALRELLSPRIFEQGRELEIFETSFLMACEMGDAPEQPAISNTEPVLIIEPACANSDDELTVQFLNSIAGADARLRWIPPTDVDSSSSTDSTETTTDETATEDECSSSEAINDRVRNARPIEVLETEREDIVLDAHGSFEGTIEVPRIRGGDGQIHTLAVLVAVPCGPIKFTDTTNQVLYRMVQTIFMALIATTIAIPIAALISFFAARNLMRRVKLSVGSLLISFIAILVGFWIGSNSYSFSGLGRFGVTIGKGELLESIGILLAFVVPALVLAGTYFLLRQIAKLFPQENKRDAQVNPILSILNTVIIAVVLIFMVGAIAGLGILVGNGITGFADGLRPAELSDSATWSQNAFADLIWSVGNMFFTLGHLVELLIAALIGIITGFAFSGIVGTITGNPVRRIGGMNGKILGAILGAIAGAGLMVIMAAFGLWAALLGVMPLLIGGILGGTVLLQIFRRVQNQAPIVTSNSQQFFNQLVFAAGFVLVAIYLFDRLSLGRAFVDGVLPPQDTVFGLSITSYTFNAALTGAILGGLSGYMAGVQGMFPLGDMLYNTSRTLLNLVRSIEPLIMGLVFVVWVGIGPFAGVLALTLHSIASLGKLYSEQIENIDPGPIEALQSTGANQLQTIIYAVVPQIVPPYIAFTMYRWDINVRMSTIIGFVGGGGIGFLLQQQINLVRYRDAGVAVLAIAVVVSVLDYASAYIRERLT